MIRIPRPLNAPVVLLTEGLARRLAHEAEIDTDLGSYSSGIATLAFDRDVYAHHTVKRALVAMQHGKCAFCEAKPLPTSDGDVEHFRPKGGARQTDADPLQRPGYYWLAYDWANLMFACERCNRRHKKSLFPLLDPARRARSHRDVVGHETPVFIEVDDRSVVGRDQDRAGASGAGDERTVLDRDDAGCRALEPEVGVKVPASSVETSGWK